MSKFYTSFTMDWDHVLLSYYENNQKHYKRIKLKPYLFIPSALSDTEYRTFDDKPVMRVDFDSVKEARNFVRQYEGVPNIKLYGSPLYHYVYIYENFKNQQVDTSKIKILNFDIEVDTSEGYPTHGMYDREINAVTIKVFKSKEIYVLGFVDYEPREQELHDLIEKGYKIRYKKCAGERELLSCFLQIWKRIDPDVITGWNISKFDIAYVIGRMKRYFDDETINSLSPFGKINHTTTEFYKKVYDVYTIVGITILDYMEIYKKFSQGVEESYSLDYLSGKILGKGKLDYSEYGNLAKLYQRNPIKYIDYNVIDVIRVEEIDANISYMDIAFEIAYETLTNYDDSLTTIRVWDAMIHNYLMDQKRVVPNSATNRKERSISGGFVKDPQVGGHKWVMSFDFKSLYPHLCMSFNISPDTYLGTLKSIYGSMSVQKILDGEIDQLNDTLVAQDVNVTGCGTVFTRKKKGFIPAIMERLFARRAEHSKQEEKYEREYAENHDEKAGTLSKIFANKSYAIKILLNSGYGALSNEFYRFFSDNIAESFTLSGQLAIKSVEKNVNKRMNELMGTDGVDYICAIDTDSFYLNLSSYVEKQYDGDDVVTHLEEFSSTVQGWIQEGLEEMYWRTNIFQKKLSMSLEAIGPAIWIAKKRYVMLLPSFKKIRYDPPKLKVMGIEAVRSTTPKSIRNWIKEGIPLAIEGNSTKIKQFLDVKWEKFINLPFEDIAMNKGTNDLEKYADSKTIYGSKTPVHVRGALLFNHMVQKRGLQKEIELIKSGDKVKMMYLKMPNPIMENVVSIPETLPVEFSEFKDYIDFSKQFDKTFLDPFKRLTDAAGINLSENVGMDQFYD